MANTIIVKCSNGFTLRASGQTVVIAKKREEETIPVSGIQSFAIKEPRGFGYGKIVFSTAKAASSGINIGFGVGVALGAERTFFFTGDEAENAFALRDFVSRGGDDLQPELQSPQPPCGKTVVSVVEEIRGLKGLLDEGILTQEEFEAKKKHLLGL